MTTQSACITVICARLVREHVPDPTHRARTDLGERPRLVTRDVPAALVWLNAGTPEDLAAAHAWCLREGHGWRAAPVPESRRADPLTWGRGWAEANCRPEEP